MGFSNPRMLSHHSISNAASPVACIIIINDIKNYNTNDFLGQKFEHLPHFIHLS